MAVSDVGFTAMSNKHGLNDKEKFRGLGKIIGKMFTPIISDANDPKLTKRCFLCASESYDEINKQCACIASSYKSKLISGQMPPEFELNFNFPLGESKRESSHDRSLTSITSDGMEEQLVKDILNLLQLNPSENLWSVRESAYSCQIKVNPNVPVILQQEALDIAVSAADLSVVIAFINENAVSQHSLARRSVADAMSKFLRQFQLAVVSAADSQRSGKLTLKTLSQCMSKQMDTMKVLTKIVHKIIGENLEGPSIATYLHNELLNCGLLAYKNIIRVCLRHSLAPFFECLKLWLKGQPFIDLKSEFMIRRRRETNMLCADFQETSFIPYEVIPENVPSFLEPVADTILIAGYYSQTVGQVLQGDDESFSDWIHDIVEDRLNCVALGDSDTEVLKVTLKAILEEISGKLFTLMKDRGDLEQHFTSISQTYLFQRADIFQRFSDFSKGQILSNNNFWSPVMLENLLAEAVCGSSASEFTQQRLGIKFFNSPLLARIAHFNVESHFISEEAAEPYMGLGEVFAFECFSTDLNGGWILKHLLSPSVRTLYECLFGIRFMLFLAESFCCQIIGTLNGGVEHQLVHRMLLFSQSVSSYFTLYAVRRHWVELMEYLIGSKKTVERLVRSHKQHLMKMYIKMMLNDLQATKLLISIIKLIIHACLSLDKVVNELHSSDHKRVIPIGLHRGDNVMTVHAEKDMNPLFKVPTDSLRELVSYFSGEFDVKVSKWLGLKIVKEKRPELIAMLTLNDHYTNSEGDQEDDDDL